MAQPSRKALPFRFAEPPPGLRAPSSFPLQDQPRAGLSAPATSLPMDLDNTTFESRIAELAKLKAEIDSLSAHVATFPEGMFNDLDRDTCSLNTNPALSSTRANYQFMRERFQESQSKLKMYMNVYEERKALIDREAAEMLSKALDAREQPASMKKPGPYTPRIIIHGGAGNILRENLSKESYLEYREVMLGIVKSVEPLLKNEGYGSDQLPNSVSQPLKDAWSNMAPMNAIDAATYALMQLEDCPLFNCGKGAVFTSEGRNELEASMMVSNGSNRRSCAISRVDTIRNPVRFVREMLVEEEKASIDRSSATKRTPQPHVHLSGAITAQYARLWDIPTVKRDYYYTEKRWLEHKRGLQKMYPGEAWQTTAEMLEDYAEQFKSQAEDDDETNRFGKRVNRGPRFGYPRDENMPVFLQPNRLPPSARDGFVRGQVAFATQLQQAENERTAMETDAQFQSTTDFPMMPRPGVRHSGDEDVDIAAPLGRHRGPRLGYRRANMQSVFVPYSVPETTAEPSNNVETPRRVASAQSARDELTRSPMLPVDRTLSVPRTEYIPQGTAGVVVMDSWGTIVVATSTGGITNKLPGRIGDTPSIGAGYWAGAWSERKEKEAEEDWEVISSASSSKSAPKDDQSIPDRAVGMSGTGNGDSFLRIAAAHRIASLAELGGMSLEKATASVAGTGGELQRSAGARWGTGEGEGGIIGIERTGMETKIVADFNCGGMFRAWVDEEGEAQMMVFKEEF